MLWGLGSPGAASHQSQLRSGSSKVSSKDHSSEWDPVSEALWGLRWWVYLHIQSVSLLPQTSKATDLCFGK